MEQFITDYLQRGWGCLNKSDFEAWIFYLLLQNRIEGFHFKTATDYQIAIALRIPESKVKKLRYEAMLKYGIPKSQNGANGNNASDFFKQRILNDVLKKVQYKADGHKVQFIVTDKLLRQYISDILSQEGRFFDTSFNSNIVSIHIDDFIFLLTQLYDKEQIDELIQLIKKSLQDVVTEFPKTTTECLSEVATAFCTGILKDHIGEFTIKAMTDGAHTIAETIKANKKINAQKHK